MISIVKVLPCPSGLIKRHKVKKGRIEPIVYFSRFKGKSIRVICVVADNNPHFEQQVKNQVGNQPVVFPKKYRPKEIKFNIPDHSEMLRRALTDRFKAVIRDISKDRRLRVLLCDKNAVCQGVAAELIQYADVSVYTAFPEEYAACKAYTYEKYGESVDVLNRPVAPKDVDYVLAPYGLDSVVVDIETAVIYSQNPSDRGISVTAEDYIYSPEIIQISDEVYYPVEVAAAIFNEQLRRQDDNQQQNDIK